MNNAIVAACGALALASTMTLSAQTPAPTPAPPGWPKATTPAEPGQKPAMGAMTLTGCLKAADGTTGAAQGAATAKPGATTPGSVMPAARFLLTDVSMDGQMRGGPMGTPTTGAPAPGAATGAAAHAMPTQYTVVGASGVDLSAHVGHKVSLTGTMAGAHSMPGMMPGDKPTAMPGDKPMAKPDMPAMRPTDAPKPATGMDHMGADKGAATFTVSSVTMISASCTATQ